MKFKSQFARWAMHVDLTCCYKCRNHNQAPLQSLKNLCPLLAASDHSVISSSIQIIIHYESQIYTPKTGCKAFRKSPKIGFQQSLSKPRHHLGLPNHHGCGAHFWDHYAGSVAQHPGGPDRRPPRCHHLKG